MSKLASGASNRAFGVRLARIRKEARLSQAAFAESLSLSLGAYAAYERGKREAPMALLRALIVVYRIDPTWMLGITAQDLRTVDAAPVVATRRPRRPSSRSAFVQHEQIKTRLHLVGSSFAAIARELNLAVGTVAGVSRGRGRSRRIEAAIAAKLGETPERLWGRE